MNRSFLEKRLATIRLQLLNPFLSGDRRADLLQEKAEKES